MHIDSPDPVVLEEAVGPQGWVPMCNSPCDRPVATDRSYRINGSGLRASSPFSIRSGSRTRIAVDPASSGARTAGVVVTVVGALGLGPGLVVTVGVVGAAIFGAILVCPFVAAFASKPNQNSEYTGCLGDAISYVGNAYASPFVWVPAIAGGVALISGVTWLATSPPTRVTQTAANAQAAASPDAWRMTPTWAERSPIALPPSVVAPLVHIAF